MPLQMTKEEREAFLADLHVGVLSIEDPDHGPLSVPIWYDFKPEVGLWILTSRSSPKGVALDRAGRFSLVAQTEQPPYKYVSVEGPIVDVRPADKEKDLRPMAQRYLGTEVGSAYADGQAADDDGHVYVMRPRRWLTVDYAKLTSGG
jgi:nitroimidazol reductase NimA-like FMN-containing flavoprotein (pyridoxamine 5'-phosphate oxidase superfamily)